MQHPPAKVPRRAEADAAIVAGWSLPGRYSGSNEPATAFEKECDLAGNLDKYIVRKPLYEDLPNEAPGEGGNPGVTETETFMSGAQVSGAPLHITWGIISAIPPKNPYVVEHDHPYDEVLFFQGFNPDNTLDLGAVFEFGLDGETHTIDSTCGIFIPAGMKHCPLTVKSVTRPCGLAAICVSGQYQTMGYATPLEAVAS